VDYYRELQVQRHADQEVIDRAYRALSMKYHPDRAHLHERESATRRMQRINEAYSVLKDPARRATYDAGLPSESGRAWDRFMDVGLVGLFLDRFSTGGGASRG
jgi:DnaJ-class molecular chaperone